MRATADRRWLAAIGIGLAAALTLTACASTDEPSDAGAEGIAQSPTPPAAKQPTAEPPSPTPPTEVPASQNPPVESSVTKDAAASGTKHSTEDGIFTWSLPAGWTATPVEVRPEEQPLLGMPYEHTTFRNADRTVAFDVMTGQGPIGLDGPPTQFIDVLDTEHLTQVPQAEDYPGEVWYQAALITLDETTDSTGEYMLSINVVTSAGGDPLNVPNDDLWSSFAYVAPPVEGHDVGTTHILMGPIGQAEAEQITGLQGEDAVRKLLDTDEYAELREVAVSMVVDIP